MKTKDQQFQQVMDLLPARLRRPLEGLSPEQRAMTEELRLRAGQAMTTVCPLGEQTVPGAAVLTPEDLRSVLEVATEGSAHTALDRVQNGFFTVRGGHRIGLCGSGVVEGGRVRNLRSLSSLSVRLAWEARDVGRPLLDLLRDRDGFSSTLILSPPGAGKTTLLRDLVRLLSDGAEGPALRVGLADERSEVAGLWEGLPQLDVGKHTDVLDGCPKGTALLMLLRGMNPQILAADEITAPEDIEALSMAANCGVALLATAHGSGLEDLKRRPLYRSLLERNIFHRLVLIRRRGLERAYEVRDLDREPW